MLQRVIFQGSLLYRRREAGDQVDQLDLMRAQRIVEHGARGQPAGFLQDAVGAHVGVLDIGCGVPVEIQCLIHVEDDVFVIVH